MMAELLSHRTLWFVVLLAFLAPALGYETNYTGTTTIQFSPAVATRSMGYGQVFTTDGLYGIIAYKVYDGVNTVWDIYLQSVTRTLNATTLQWHYVNVGAPVLVGTDFIGPPSPGDPHFTTMSLSISDDGSKVGYTCPSATEVFAPIMQPGLYRHNVTTGTFQLVLDLGTNPAMAIIIVASGTRGQYYTYFNQTGTGGIGDPLIWTYKFIDWTSTSPVVSSTSYSYNSDTYDITQVLAMDRNETVIAYYPDRDEVAAGHLTFVTSQGQTQPTFPSINVGTAVATGVAIETESHSAVAVLAYYSDGTGGTNAGRVLSWKLNRTAENGWNGTWVAFGPIVGTANEMVGAQVSLVYLNATGRWRMAVGVPGFNGSWGAIRIYEETVGSSNWTLRQTLTPFGSGTTNVNANLGYYWYYSSMFGTSANGSRIASSGPCADVTCPGAVYIWESLAVPDPPVAPPVAVPIAPPVAPPISPPVAPPTPVAPPLTPCGNDCECNTPDTPINECVTCLNSTCQITRTCGVEDPGLVCVMDNCFAITPSCSVNEDCTQVSGCSKCIGGSCRQINNCPLGCASPEMCLCNTPPPPVPIAPCTSDCECNTADTPRAECRGCVDGACVTTHTCVGSPSLCQMGTCITGSDLCLTSNDCPQALGCTACIGNALGFLLGICRQINNCTLGCSSATTCQCNVPPPPSVPPSPTPVIPPVPIPIPPIPPSPQPPASIPAAQPTSYAPLPIITDPPRPPGIGPAGPITGPTSIIPEYIDDTPTYVKVLTFVAAAGIVLAATYMAWICGRVYRTDIRGERSRLL